MTVPFFGGCFHCEEKDHWAEHCPLLVPPAGKAEHEQRFKRVMERFWNHEITPHGKRRVIETENRMWEKKKKEMEKANEH
jgi:hypothetical protein